MYLTLRREYADNYSVPVAVDELTVGDVPDESGMTNQSIAEIMCAFFDRSGVRFTPDPEELPRWKPRLDIGLPRDAPDSGLLDGEE